MGLKVGLLGVGLVGDRIVRALRERHFPIDGELVVMATSEREEVLADFQQSPGIVLMDGITSGSAATAVRQDPLERQYPVTRDLFEVSTKIQY
jgi:aspartate-semialdehyde dehydrogenase